MEIKFSREPNIVYECAHLLFKIVNHESYRDKRSFYASKYQADSALLDACFASLSEAVREVSASVRRDLRDIEPYFKKNALGSCCAYYLLHDAMCRPHEDIYAAADAIKAITKAEFFLNFYSMLRMQDKRAKFDRDVKNYNDLINFIASMSIPDEEKWELCRFYNNFETNRAHLASLMFRIGEIYYKIYDSIDSHVTHYIETVESPLDLGGVGYLNSNFGLALNDEIHSVTVVPSVILCTDTEYLYNFTGDTADDYLFVGGYYDPLGKISGDGEKLRDLCGSLRTLGDASKLKILKVLLTGPRYGQELSALLGISTATISHHVSILEEYGFITLERRQNRVYYSLNRERITELFEQLNAELV